MLRNASSVLDKLLAAPISYPVALPRSGAPLAQMSTVLGMLSTFDPNMQGPSSIKLEVLEEALEEAAVEKSKNDELCSVCGDMATGRHYGAIACNGCKGFFRRTIRRGYKYTCRFQGNCTIERHTRAVCRFCRYTKCVKCGMRDEAVQHERDAIGKRVRPGSVAALRGSMLKSGTSEDGVSSSRNSSPEQYDSPEWDNQKYLLENLLVSENMIQSMRDSVIKQTSDAQFVDDKELSPGKPDEKTADINDIFLSLHSQLHLVIAWARSLPAFESLSGNDQKCLLKNFAAQHVVLCVAYRSIDGGDFLKLLNDSCIPRNKGKREGLTDLYFRDCERVMDQMVAPMRMLRLDDTEFVAMKACVLFDPVTKGLSPTAVPIVLRSRRQIFSALESYIKKKCPEDKDRLGDILFFMLSPLQSIANTLSEDVLVTKLSGITKIDQLMEELILSDAEEQKSNQSALRSNFATAFDGGPNHGVMESEHIHANPFARMIYNVHNGRCACPGLNVSGVQHSNSEPTDGKSGILQSASCFRVAASSAALNFNVKTVYSTLS